MPELNFDLLKKVQTEVLAKPSTHDQSRWGSKGSCGTRMCLAGHACVLSGTALDWRPSDYTDNLFLAEFTTDGDDVPSKAAELLGLDDDQADVLFWCLDEERALDLLAVLVDTAERGENLTADELDEV